ARHPAVLEAAVLGVPDERWGEVGRAFILLREEEYAAAEDLTRYARENLAAYKVPKSFVFVTEFPRTAAGKIQKHLLSAEGPTTPSPESISIERTLTQDDFNAFAQLSGDDNPIHVDPEFSARTSFGRTVSHGMLLYTILRGLAGRLAPGTLQVSQDLMFPAPTFADEPIRFLAKIEEDNGSYIQIAMRAERSTTDECVCEASGVFRREA
ncbi:MAG: MaoC/PaaZ C-terminal domain-containing protein, partial [Pseudomonadota bacterium]